jgi:hypothetical protein
LVLLLLVAQMIDHFMGRCASHKSDFHHFPGFFGMHVSLGFVHANVALSDLFSVLCFLRLVTSALLF